MPKMNPLLGATLLVLLAAVGCSHCEKKTVAAPSGVTRWVPQTVEAAVVVPDLGVLGDRLTLLQTFKIANFAAQLQGFPDATAFGNALVRQAGVDLRSRDELKKAGIDPGKGVAVALLPGNVAYAVVGVADAGALGATIKRLAQTRLGASAENKAQVDGREHIWFSRAGTKPELGYLIVEGFALIAPGEAAARLPEFARLQTAASLAEEAKFKAALARLPNERDVILHAPARPNAKTRLEQAGITAAAHLSKEALVINGDLPWTDAAMLTALEKKDGPELAKQLPSDAFLVARLLTDPVALEPIWPTLVGPYLKRAFEQAQLDVKGEILSNLHPGAVASLSVSPSIPLGAGMPQMDVRRTNPFRYAHLVALARPKSPEKVTALLSRMPEIAPKFGATIEPLDREGKKLFLTKYAQGEGVHFAQANEGDVLFASPLARLEKQLTSPAAGAAPPPPMLQDAALKDALNASAVNVVVDLNQLRESLRALPPEAWGIGGFAIKASAMRWLDATDDLRAITVNAGRKDNSAQVKLSLRFAQR